MANQSINQLLNSVTKKESKKIRKKENFHVKVKMFQAFVNITLRQKAVTTCRQDLQLLQLTYLLTARCRVLLEKLTGLQLVKKFPAFHGTRRFITAFTSVRHLSLS